MPPVLRDAYDFTKALRGQVPGPHKIWLAKTKIQSATNVITGRWLAACSNFEHEQVAEKQGHLPLLKVEALISGLPAAFDDPRKQIVYELATTLAAPCRAGRHVPARRGFAGRGRFVDVTVLMG